MAKNYYKTLGLRRTATAPEIKRAFRLLARQFHPDFTGNDQAATAHFRECLEAYGVLSDPEKRQHYDTWGTLENLSSNGEPADENPPPSAQGLGEFFRTLFGPKVPPTPEEIRPHRGEDVEVEVTIGLLEAYTGTKALIPVEIPRTCDECRGHVWLNPDVTATCPECDGIGLKKVIGPIPFTRGCDRCDGTGSLHNDICPKCDFTGLINSYERLEVKVPAGVANNSRVCTEGMGASGKFGGENGDLFMKVRVRAHERYVRQGNDLYTSIDIGFNQAVSGGDVDLPRPLIVRELPIPPATQGGHIFAIPKAGFKDLKTGLRGQLYVTVHIRVPTKLSKDAATTLRRLTKMIPDL